MHVPEATDNRGLKHMFVSVSTFDNKQNFACFLTMDRCDLAKSAILVVELRGAHANLHFSSFLHQIKYTFMFCVGSRGTRGTDPKQGGFVESWMVIGVG